jgi:hypothetical protein
MKKSFAVLVYILFGVFMSVVSIIGVFSVDTCFAQFPNLEQLSSDKALTTTGVSLQELAKNKEKTATSYLRSIRSVSVGLEATAKAFGIQNQITDKLAMINSLQPGNISDAGLVKVREASDAIVGMLKAKMQGQAGLDPASQGLFMQGVTGLVSNINNLQNLIPEIKGLLSMAQGTLATAPIQDKLKVQDMISTISTLSKNIPLDLKSSQGALSMLSSYASTHGIAIPKEAIDLLKAK